MSRNSRIDRLGDQLSPRERAFMWISALRAGQTEDPWIERGMTPGEKKEFGAYLLLGAGVQSTVFLVLFICKQIEGVYLRQLLRITWSPELEAGELNAAFDLMHECRPQLQAVDAFTEEVEGQFGHPKVIPQEMRDAVKSARFHLAALEDLLEDLSGSPVKMTGGLSTGETLRGTLLAQARRYLHS